MKFEQFLNECDAPNLLDIIETLVTRVAIEQDEKKFRRIAWPEIKKICGRQTNNRITARFKAEGRESMVAFIEKFWPDNGDPTDAPILARTGTPAPTAMTASEVAAALDPIPEPELAAAQRQAIHREMELHNKIEGLVDFTKNEVFQDLENEAKGSIRRTLRAMKAEKAAIIERMPAPKPELADWQKRVIAEELELQGKIERLTAFLDSHRSGSVVMVDEVHLHQQRAAMRKYQFILDARIARF